MLTSSTEAVREEHDILFFREGLNILQAAELTPPRQPGLLDPHFALQRREPEVTIITAQVVNPPTYTHAHTHGGKSIYLGPDHGHCDGEIARDAHCIY